VRCASALVVLAFCPAALAQDPARGKLLYETHCGGCHYERVHERMQTKVGDMGDLRDEVARWAAQTRRPFTLEDLEDVVQYLNESHYRLGLPPAERPKLPR
jgi:mono/diheme cytochrome c family protein